MTATTRRRWRRAVTVGAVLALAAVAAGGAGAAAQEPPPTEPVAGEPPPIEPAPPGFAGELDAIYRAAAGALGDIQSMAGPDATVDPPQTPTEFEAAVAALTPDQLAMIYQATQSIDSWSGLVDTYDQLATDTAQARALIPEPPAPPDPSAPVEPIEQFSCPGQPPGPSFGNDAAYAAGVAQTAIETVSGAMPDELLTGETSIPNPAKQVIAVVAEITAVVGHTLEFLHDRYFLCEVENQYLQTFNVDTITNDLYALLEVASGTLDTIDVGVGTVSGQLAALQATTTETLRTDIQVALALPVGSPPNVAYEIPAAHGGYLDTEPVGVRAIVTGSLAAAQRAHLPVNGAAITYLAQADAALAAGSYVSAYQLYQRAYQGLVGA